MPPSQGAHVGPSGIDTVSKYAVLVEAASAGGRRLSDPIEPHNDSDHLLGLVQVRVEGEGLVWRRNLRRSQRRTRVLSACGFVKYLARDEVGHEVGHTVGGTAVITTEPPWVSDLTLAPSPAHNFALCSKNCDKQVHGGGGEKHEHDATIQPLGVGTETGPTASLRRSCRISSGTCARPRWRRRASNAAAGHLAASARSTRGSSGRLAQHCEV